TVLHFASAAVLLLVLMRAGFQLIERYLLLHLSQKIDVTLTMEFYQHVLRMPLRFFENRTTGDILSRLNDAQKIRNVVAGTVLASTVDIVFIVVSSCAMFFYDWRLAFVTLSVLPVFVLIVFGHRRSIRAAQLQAMRDNA